LHRESGYKRFFITIFAFAFGLIMVILAGSIDILFAGWEIVGISSFLLIAFYRDRIQPVRNALRAYTVYRFCDIGLLLGAWMIHLYLHESDHFSKLYDLFENSPQAPASLGGLTIISLLLIVAASGKSAQFPFCFWLPRAMEGPTPSSAIFYGALSVHLGVFLLLRTLPIWSYHFITCAMVFCIGLATMLIASLSEKTQSNIKGQVAYASIAQVGIMFMELAVGLEYLVLIHFLGNAFLRCYQLLVSPSIVAQMLRIEGAIDSQQQPIKSISLLSYLPKSVQQALPEVLRNTLYVLALQEGNLELLIRWFWWSPLKRAGAKINAVKRIFKWLAISSIILLFLIVTFTDIPLIITLAAPIFALAMLACSLSAFSQKHGFISVWNAVGSSSLLAAGTVWLLNAHAGDDVSLFVFGIVPSWLIGIVLLSLLLKGANPALSPFAYRANAEIRPLLTLGLFFSFLGLVGFPITSAFIGIDLLLYHSQHGWLASLIAVCFVINGISAARMFLRLSMGRVEVLNIVTHKKVSS
jgi:NADH:ubiquinone oxidoreductase subunit 2 (subunit N)